jgi:CubicO group peptidase (beta-lactamase class C family)
MRNHRYLTAVTLGVLCATALAAQAPATQAPAAVDTRVRRFVNVGVDDANQRLDWIEPPAQPFPLGEASDRAFTVSYTHGGKPYTLGDYFTRTDVLAFLILKDGKPVFERYLVGTGPTDRYLSMSVSKSIVSVLVGVAVDDKKIASIDDRVVKYLPRLKDSGYQDVTIRNLLNMASGIAFSEDYGVAGSGIGQLTAANRSGNPSYLEFIASLKSEKAPGTFNYQSVNTQVLAEVLKAATGLPLNVYAETKLWKKIGAESRAYFLTGRNQEGICAYGCFYATLRDYARFGLMAMRGGQLTSQRVVSEGWLKQSVAPFAKPSIDTDTGRCRRGYGFQWWIPCSGDAFQATGINGQAIYINPSKRIVVAQFSARAQATDPDQMQESAEVFDAIADRLK